MAESALFPLAGAFHHALSASVEKQLSAATAEKLSTIEGNLMDGQKFSDDLCIKTESCTVDFFQSSFFLVKTFNIFM